MNETHLDNTVSRPLVFTDFVWPEIPNIEQTVEAFRVRTTGDPREHLIALDGKTGDVIASNIGNDSQVEVPLEARGGFIIHSHSTMTAPLSIPDLLVIPSFKALGNMAVCGSGMITWTTGALDRSFQMANAMHMFQESSEVQLMLKYLEYKGKSEDVGSIAGGWYFLDFFLRNGTLANLHVRGDDNDLGLRGRALAEDISDDRQHYPRDFSVAV